MSLACRSLLCGAPPLLRQARSMALGLSLVAWPGGAAAYAAGGSDPGASAPTISTVMLPGGVEGLRRALNDRTAMSPALALADVARRFYGGSDGTGRGDASPARLMAWLQACTRIADSASAAAGSCGQDELKPDPVPLPGTPRFWREVVLERNVSDAALVPSILSDRRALLLYTALLSLEPGTRRSMLARGDIVRRLTEDQAGAFVVGAPYLRMADGTWTLPGDLEARPVWMALAGVTSPEPSTFIPAFLSAEQGLVPYVAELAATLTPAQRAHALGLDRAGPADRIAAARGLMSGVRAALAAWRPGERPFWRPAPDPAFLLGQLPVGPSGRLNLPGGRRFWESVFAGSDPTVPEDAARSLWADPAAPDAPWIIARVFGGHAAGLVTRYEQVLVGARLFAEAGEARAHDVHTVLRGHARFPELVRTLERLGVTEPRGAASIVRRAHQLSGAGGSWRARAATVQWQSAIALLVRTVDRGTSSRSEAALALEKLAEGGESDEVAMHGGTLRWVAGWLGGTLRDADPRRHTIGRALAARLAASGFNSTRPILWEDSPYLLDFEAAERLRLDRVRGRSTAGWIDAALTALDLADRLDPAGGSTADAVHLDRFRGLIDAAGLSRTPADDEFSRAAREAAASAERRIAQGGRRSGAREALHDLADALGAAALLELTYAVHMGWAEGLPLRAIEAARRHRLTVPATGGRSGDIAWAAPRIVTGEGAPWHVSGGVLGLDVALAPVTLRRLSLKPPAAAPTLSDGNRQLLTTTVVLLDRRVFTPQGQEQLVDLLGRARDRLSEAREAGEVETLAARAGASPLRAGIAGWLAATRRESVTGFLSLTELVRLGLEGKEVPEPLRSWGNRETPLSGRQACGQLPHLFWERYAGRWGTGMLLYAVPDLQLALGSQLSRMGLPAVLVPDLMESAVQDLAYSVPARHPDDWQAVTDWIQALEPLRVERYLGRLTTDGPLRQGRSRPARP